MSQHHHGHQGHEALHRKRTREHMHMHGMLQMPRNAAAVTTTKMFGFPSMLKAVQTWVKSHVTQTNIIRADRRREAAPATDQLVQQDDNAFAEENRRFAETQEKIKKYQYIANRFIPNKAGGSLEEGFICQNGGNNGWTTIKDPIYRSGTDDQPMIDPITLYDTDAVYRVMPGFYVITGKMLLDLIRWPVLLGASDNALEEIMTLLTVPREAFGSSDEESQKEMHALFAADDANGIGIFDECMTHYNTGQLNFDDWAYFLHLCECVFFAHV